MVRRPRLLAPGVLYRPLGFLLGFPPSQKNSFAVDIFVCSSITVTSATRLIFIVPAKVFKIGSGSEAFGEGGAQVYFCIE
jgi:hypothetical protein